MNQHTAIELPSGEVAFSCVVFSPTFDADGNQTLVKTSTGIWSVSYNAENRPITFTKGTTTIHCKYDSLGRRFEKKVVENGATVFWQRYAYENYLQIAAFDVTEPTPGSEICTLKHTVFWDPSEPVATRPLAISIVGEGTFFCTHDLTKNVCELIDTNLEIAQTYDYAPFGAVEIGIGIPSGGSAIALNYYNYRHYNPADGRWLSRDPISERGGWNLYAFVRNDTINVADIMGAEGIISDLLHGACCNGKKYYANRQCCINKDGKKSLWGKVGYSLMDRKDIATRIVRKDAYGRYGLPWLLQHSWIEYPGGSAGFYPTDNKSKVLYPGEVRIPETFVPSEEHVVESTAIVLNQCDYDIEKFEACIPFQVEQSRQNPDIYFLPANNCQQWRLGIILACKKVAAR